MLPTALQTSTPNLIFLKHILNDNFCQTNHNWICSLNCAAVFVILICPLQNYSIGRRDVTSTCCCSRCSGSSRCVK